MLIFWNKSIVVYLTCVTLTSEYAPVYKLDDGVLLNTNLYHRTLLHVA